MLRLGIYLRKKFQRNGGINRDVPADTESHKGSQNKNAVVIRGGAKTQAKDGSNQNGAIEGVLTS